jgi:WXG100 family type VII secretion target
MTNTEFQLNYDQLEPIARKFKDEGEALIKLHSSTRKHAQDLRKEWIGEAAEKFFEELETELLPALQRLSQALFQSQDVSGEIMKIIQEADQETAGYFGNQLSGDDAGSETPGQDLKAFPAGDPGSDDLETGNLGETSTDTTPASGDPRSSTPEDDKKSMDSQQERTESQQRGGGKPEEQSKKEQESEAPTAGGGGGSTPSEGVQGDLNNMGAGLGNQSQQWVTTDSGAAAVNIPDHIYSSGSSTPSSGGSVPDASSGSNSGEQASSAGSGSIAAGVAGVAGTAAAVVKVIKEMKDRAENK